jgi:hypothetical protein
MHAERSLDDRHACGEREAAVDGRMDEDAVAEEEHPDSSTWKQGVKTP